jgi:hypothetical protein
MAGFLRTSTLTDGLMVSTCVVEVHHERGLLRRGFRGHVHRRLLHAKEPLLTGFAIVA